MRKTVIIAMALLVAVAGAAVAKDKVYGKGVSEGEITKISTIMDDTEAYQGKNVRISGTAVAICTHRGCWVDVSSDREGETLRVKVPDGVIVFPKSIIGKPITAEGVFTANHVTADNHKCSRDHEGGEEAVTCTTSYQISGVGAVVSR